MSGHSKWSTIKRAKGATDARRGQLFTKLAREITVAARAGGPDPEGNTRLRLAVQRARDQNMPTDNIDRAIRRGAGTAGEGQLAIHEVTYEGYGPGGAAIFLEAMTDNLNRTVSELRNVMSRGGGSLGERGCVAWNFDPKGVIAVEPSPDEAERLALLAIDAGAEDFELYSSYLEVRTAPANFEQVRKALEQQEAKLVRAEVAKVPKAVVLLESKTAFQMLRLLDRLEELDDIQRVYSNADFSLETLEEYQKTA